ncbi:MAG TPA: hypothetical protein VFZ61_03885, partial [Polyangiales bacterium]
MAWSVLERWKTDFYAQLGRAESLERDLAAERAAHEATRATLREVRTELAGVREVMRKQENRIGWAMHDQRAAEKRAAELEQDRDNWRDQYQDGAKTLRGRIAELERERDEARAKLGALREWAERAIRVDTSEGYVFAARDVANLIEPQPGELLLAESPKPGDVLSGDPFQDSLAHLINACGFESTFGDMPDHIASRLLVEVGRLVGSAIRQRDAWMGRKPWHPGEDAPEPAKPATPDLDLAGRLLALNNAVRAMCTVLTAEGLLDRVSEKLAVDCLEAVTAL